MKRFYCTVCQKVKRAQKWPDVITHQSADSPKLREGKCNKHERPMLNTSRVINVRKRA